MKKILFYSLMMLLVASFTSCDDFENSAEASKTTFLPKLTMMGDANITLACNATSYTDDGLTASVAGEPVEVNTDINARYFGGTEVSGTDVYEITYSALNSDNIPGAAVRTVTIPACNGDLVSSIAGMYTSSIVRNGFTSPQYTDVGPIIIKDLGNNVYAISDAIGGWYEFGRGLGYTYAAPGFTVTANDIPSNDFTLHGDNLEVGSFGGALTMTGFKVFPETKTITISSDWEFGFVFEVTLTQM
jgi:hypothetical protein